MEKCHPKCLDISRPAVVNCYQTGSGLKCQRWDVNSPHDVKYKPIISMHNNCASPDGDAKPWCYTTDPEVRWEYCHPKCQVIPMTTTTITSTTTTPTTTPTTPKPLQINRTVKNPYHHMIPPYNQCGVQNSDKLKSKISCYEETGFCWTCRQSMSTPLPCKGVSRRSMSSTGWQTSLPGDSKIYYAEDKATSFDFPWFVRVGIGYICIVIL